MRPFLVVSKEVHLRKKLELLTFSLGSLLFGLLFGGLLLSRLSLSGLLFGGLLLGLLLYGLLLGGLLLGGLLLSSPLLWSCLLPLGSCLLLRSFLLCLFLGHNPSSIKKGSAEIRPVTVQIVQGCLRTTLTTPKKPLPVAFHFAAERFVDTPLRVSFQRNKRWHRLLTVRIFKRLKKVCNWLRSKSSKSWNLRQDQVNLF